MATKKKMLQAAAGQAGGGSLDIDEVFSTYLYTGTGSALTINNGIDLAGEGGLTWIKDRTGAGYNWLWDTERGATKSLATNLLNGTIDRSTGLTVFNSNGFTLGSYSGVNASNYDFASWTFRKAPKFFDVIKYSGDSNATRSIPHGLGSSVGMIIIKTLNANDNWLVYHRGLPNGLGTGRLKLNLTNAVDGTTNFLSADSSSVTFASNAGGNYSGNEYVMYLFAHNDSGDGEFGPDGDQDIIKCGSYTGNGSVDGPEIDLGFEPQWLLHKRTDSGDGWPINDILRGFALDSVKTLRSNNSSSEGNSGAIAHPTATGFKLTTADNEWNASGGNYIYMAIRRGSLAPPESATEVFAHSLASGYPRYPSGFTTDFVIQKRKATGGGAAYSRLQGNNNLDPSTTAQESASAWDWAQMTGSGTNFTSTDYIGWSWKRAPSFFDISAYSGNSTAGNTVSHNLGAVPEMIWVKHRNGSDNWAVYHKGLNGGTTPENYYLNIDTTAAENTQVGYWNNTAPTDSNFTVGTNPRLNDSAGTYIAYLFASLAGISKVGSYTGTGATLNIDCGFTSGARFVILKRTDAGGQWFVFDSTRGIVSGNDPFLRLNTTGAEETAYDIIDPISSGFSLTSNNDWETNISGGSYIFYAIA